MTTLNRKNSLILTLGIAAILMGTSLSAFSSPTGQINSKLDYQVIPQAHAQLLSDLNLEDQQNVIQTPSVVQIVGPVQAINSLYEQSGIMVYPIGNTISAPSAVPINGPVEAINALYNQFGITLDPTGNIISAPLTNTTSAIW